VLTVVYAGWFGVAHHTIVALSFLLIVLIVAARSTQRVAIATSLLAFACFNFFFLPPVGTFRIAGAENWAALFALLAVSLIGSHLSALARRRAQEALSAELKSALLASLGHDLKTPLTAATIAANNATAAWLTEEQRREQMDILIDELERLNRLFRNIIEMAAIESDAVVVEREWVQTGEIVDAAVKQVEPLLARRALEIDLGSDRPIVHLDPRLTTAALGHILENAARYSPENAPITVTVAVSSDGLRIAVRDRGPGLSAPSDGFGTGLGLAITRGLLAVEGGTVSAANHPDGGAVFTISVPARTKSAAELDGVET
jgi:two-component system, OmpR family, sensor histidine kinase KdpD